MLHNAFLLQLDNAHILHPTKWSYGHGRKVKFSSEVTAYSHFYNKVAMQNICEKIVFSLPGGTHHVKTMLLEKG